MRCQECERETTATTTAIPPRPYCHARDAGHVCAMFFDHNGAHSSYCIEHQWPRRVVAR